MVVFGGGLTVVGGVVLALILSFVFKYPDIIESRVVITTENRTQTEKIRNDIQLEITEVFFAVLLAQENIKISENAISSAEKQITVITQSVRAGRTSNIDLLEMQAQIEKERGNLIAAKKQYELNLIRLKKAMGAPPRPPKGGELTTSNCRFLRMKL